MVNPNIYPAGSRPGSRPGGVQNLINIKVMEKIKNQVSTIVVYKGATLEEVNQEYTDLLARIDEGIERMKAAKVFASHEIEEIRKYAHNLRNNRYNDAYSKIKESIRDNFEF